MRCAASIAALLLVAGCGGNNGTSPTIAGSATSTTSAAQSSTTTIDPISGVGIDPVIPFSPREKIVLDEMSAVGVFPSDPAGMVYVFHGSGGSERIVDQVEMIDILNHLERAGFAWIATASTDRDRTRAWNVRSADIDRNPDLARMKRLHESLVASGRIDADRPVYGLGMSNGARFTGLWADALLRAGLPVRAAVMVMGTIDRKIGTIEVPTLLVTAVNDDRVPVERITDQFEAARAAGAEVRLITLEARPVTDARFTRIPGVDSRTARLIREELVESGLVDEAGSLVGDLARLAPVVQGLDLPLSRGQRREVINQVMADLAGHQVNAVVGPDITDWLLSH